MIFKSHSTRVRGLKFHRLFLLLPADLVALYTSAWIEITVSIVIGLSIPVALYTSAWIEIRHALLETEEWSMSHSTRVRGLKWLLKRPYSGRQ